MANIDAPLRSPVTRDDATRLPRLWPALALVALYWSAWLIATLFLAGTFQQFLILFWMPLAVAVGLLVWWLALSRLPWSARLWGPACVIVGGLVALWLCHPSMRFGLLLYALPVGLSAVVLWIVATGGARSRLGWLGTLAASLLAWGYFTLIRFDGVTGGFAAQRSWRWSPTAEDIFLAEQKKLEVAKEGEPAPANEPLVATAGDWPEFRGVHRDGHLRSDLPRADWATNPPRERWRRRVGPGWGSFAVVGERAFTQEQRGEMEAVFCFDIRTGNEIWSHGDKARFEEIVAGAGPRATPTFHSGQIYSLGGSGLLNCLDAATGRVVWKRDIAKEANTKPPQWGFSSSPLVAHGAVSVFAGGKDGKSVLAFDAQSGEPRWSGGKGVHGYSSPQLARIADVDQVLMVSEQGLEAFDPETGNLLWEHAWNLQDVFRVCQPTVVGSQVLIGTGMGFGTRLVDVVLENGTWEATEKWTTKDLKPYFNDAVVRDRHLYGFDGALLVCIDLATGKKKWKKGRYGYGQILQVGDAGQLVVLSEQGEVALTEATPTDLKELAKFPAIKGKTWNHPVIASGVLLVRNGEEMACFDLDPPAALAASE